jgi:hypothetical protein
MLTLDAQRRDSNDKFAPSVTAQVRFLGSRQQGFALAALGRFKTEGFADLEGELEAGILASFVYTRLHLDLNGVAGGDVEGREGDAELLVRAGYDVLPFLRLGAEGRGRYRLAGHAELPGNRVWDAIAGAQVSAFANNYFGALTIGPSTVGIADNIGWSALVSVGGVAF